MVTRLFRSHFLRLFFFAVFLSLFLSQSAPPVAAYETGTHQELNDLGAQLVRATDGEMLYREIYEDAYITQLRQGAVDEDDFPRFFNHFFQPASRLGLPEIFGSGNHTDAVTWARNSNNNLTWTGAIDSYDYTNAAKLQAYLRLGHVAHFVGDMAQPDHVHLEPHGPNESGRYEPWVVTNWPRLAPNIANRTPFQANRMEEFLEHMAGITYNSSSFEGGALYDAAGDPLPVNPALPFHQMFIARYSTWGINQWELYNRNADGSRGTHLGNWDNDYGHEDNFWETRAETGAGDAGFYYVEDIVRGIPVVYAPRTGVVRPNPNQEPLGFFYATELLPLAVDHIAGLYQHYFDIVNHPPYVASVKVTQAGRCIYEQHWEDHTSNNRLNNRTLEDDCNTPEEERWVNAEDGEVQVEITFGPTLNLPDSGEVHEPIDEQSIQVNIGGQPVTQQSFDETEAKWIGTFTPPTDGSIDGEQTIEITASDQHNHYSQGRDPGDELDANPDSPARAGSAEPYAWQGYTPGPDENHKIKIDTQGPEIRVRYRTVGSRCEPRYEIRAEVQDQGSGDGRSGLLRVTASPGGTFNPASDPQTVQMGSIGVGQSMEWQVEAEDKAGNIESKAANQPGPSRPPGCDHSDDNYSAASPQAQVGSVLTIDDESPRVAVLSNGFAPDSSGFINALREPNILVEPDFSPDIVEEYPLLVIPTGGLYGLENSAFFRATLEEYANRGGTIIVFDQQHGDDYGVLPGGGLEGYGWAEDNSCTLSSLYIRNYDQIVSGFNDAILNSNVDGYFTSLPENSDVLLHRSKNGQPAMVRYTYGAGTVIATTAYDDWGVTNWQTTADAYILNRDLLAWAVDPALLPEFDPGAPLALPVQITNNSAVAATAVKLTLLAPGKQIISEEIQPLSLDGGLTVSVTFNATAAQPLGIWRVDYTLLADNDRVIQERQPGERFVVKDPHPLSAPVKEVAFSVNAPTEDFISGSAGEFTFTVFNHSTVSRTLQVRYGLPHHTWETGDRATYGNFSDLSQTVVVAPNSSAQFIHVFPMRTNDRLFAYLYEGGSLKDQTWFQTRKAVAVATTTLTMGQAEYGRDQSVAINANVTNQAGGHANYTLNLKVTAPDNTTVFTDTRSLSVAPGATATEPFAFILPTHVPNGTFRVKADLFQGNAQVNGSISGFALPTTPARFTVSLPDALPASGSDPLQITVNNPHPYLPITGTLAVAVSAPDGLTMTLGTQPYALAAGQSATLDYDLTGLPASFGAYTFAFVSQDQYSGKTWEHTADVALAPGIVFNQRTYRVRDTLGISVTLRNDGAFGVTPQVTLAVPDLSFSEAQAIPLAAGQTAVLTYTFPLPATFSPNFHAVNLAVEAGTVISQTGSFFVPPSRVIATMDQLVYAVGESPVVTLNNSGGVDGPVTGTLQLIDQYGISLTQHLVDVNVLAGQTTPISLTIPSGAISGPYLLTFKGQNTDTAAGVNFQRSLDVSGVAASIQVHTAQPAYFSDEEITTLADLFMSSGALTDGDLNLRICSANLDGGGDTLPTSRLNYTSQTVPFNWIDIASGGALVARGSNTSTLVNLGFTFEFYGNSYSQVYVSSEGYVSFGSGSSTSTNGAIPSVSTPNNAIYALWDDLYPIGGSYGSIYAQQIDASRFVIQWQQVAHCCSTSSPETFQVILDGSDDSITMQYLDVSSTGSATVGVENFYGSAGVQVAYNQSDVIYDGLALRFATTQIAVEEVNYQSTAVPINWVDIASGGSVVAQGDNTSTLVDIGFPFQFYGITYTQMYVGSNGLISFGAGYSHSANTAVPSPSTPNNAIYAFWDDLYPVGGAYGNVYVAQVDATRTAVQWQNVGRCCSTVNPETFQVILDGSDYSVTLQYLDMSSTGSATVGVENSNGTEAVQILYNQAGVIDDDMAFKLTPAILTVPDVNYSSTAVAYNWQDIASGGTVVALGDNTYTQVDLGFPFQFYGITYTQMYVGSNGYVTFDGAFTDPFNTAIPDPNYPNNAIYAFWDDLYPVGGDYGAIYTQYISPTRYIVQWQGVTHCCDQGQPETFQIILDGADHSVTLQYQNVTDTSDATIGVENGAGTHAIPISVFQTGIITDNLALRLAPAVVLEPQVVYTNTAVAFDWHDVSATGTIVAEGLDVYSVVDIGFPFQFYGITYTQMYVGGHGYVTFGDGYTQYSSHPIPDTAPPNNAIYAFWDDMYPNGGMYGNVYTEQISPTLHVIQWQEVSHCCSTGQPETFQIILDGSDNTVTLQYLEISNPYNAVVGTENASGTTATFLAYGDPTIITNTMAYKFSPIAAMVEVASYLTSTVPFDWQNAGPEPGTGIFQGSNTYTEVDLGFPFQFYGITYTHMYIGSNGFVSFEDGYTNSANHALPNTSTPNNAIYALWDSLYPIGGAYGQIYTRQISPTQYVVQWEGAMHCCSTLYPETFQIILDGVDHSVTLQYEDVTLTNSATAGVENRLGTRATQIAYNQSGIINDNTAFRLTPDTQYVQISSYLATAIPLSWEDVAPEAGTGILIGSNTYTEVDLGFPFQFYGITYTHMYIGSNGFVSFEDGYTNSANHALPNTSTPNNAIYALWDSLYPIGGAYGQIYTRQISPTQYVVQWEGAMHCCSTLYPETFQIILDGVDHSVTLQYEDVTLTNSATVGVEEKFGIRATQLAYNQSGVINDGTAFRLTPLTQTVSQTSYITATVPLTWENIAPEVGTEVVAVGTNTFSQLSLGFPFRFYGNVYTDIYVGSNGYVTFGGGATSNANTAVPHYLVPNNAIFGLWDYLNPSGGTNGQIYARQVSSTQYVLQWERVTHCCSGTSPETFQIILDGADDTITLQYEDVSLTNSASVGVENEFGTRGLQLAFNQSGVIIDGLALQLTPEEEEIPPPPICDPTIPQPIDLMLVIDRSGSMAGQPIVDAKAAANAFVDFLDLGVDRVGLASFATSASLNHPLTQDGAAVQSAVNSLVASGSTAIGEGVAVAHTQLMNNATPGVTPVIVLLSDGQNNAGRDPFTAANAAKADGIKIVTIGLGSGADAPLMRAMASTEDDYHFAPASSDLQDIFASIANSICRSPLPYDASCGGFVLWETTLPVTVTTTLSVTELVEPLNVSGRLNLDGRVFAQTGQPLSQDVYPFYLHDRNTALTLETDRKFYHPDEAIHVTGQVTNTSLLTVTSDLRVWAEDALLLNTPLTLGPGQGYTYMTTFTDTANLDDPNLNFIAGFNGISVYKLVIVDDPQLAASLDAPDVVGRAPFQTSLTITNTGSIPATIDAAITGVVSDTVTLLPGKVIRLEGFLSIAQDTAVTAPIQGDLNQILSKQVIFGEAAALAFTPEPVYPVGPVDVPYLITNTGLLAVSFDVDITLRDAAENVVQMLTLPVDLPVGENVADVLPFGSLPAGDYVLEYNTFFASGTEPFSVVAKEDADLSAAAGIAQGPTVPVTATVTNTGYTSFSGQVQLATSFFEANVPVANLAVGQQVNLPMPVDTAAAAAGDYPATLTLFNLAGTLVDSDVVTLTVVAPDLVLVSLPENLTLPVSTTVTMTFGVQNQGGAAGDGLLGLAFSDVVDEEQLIWLPPGDAGTVDFSFFVPPDLEAKTYPASYTFNGQPGILLLTVEGIDIGVTPSLDRPGYYEGETAVLTLHIQERADRFTPPLYALVRFNEYTAVQPFNLTPSGSADVAFDVPVSFLGDEKVFYGIYNLATDRSIHLNTIYLPQLYPDVTVLTDKQVYLPGETVVATVVTTATGQLDAVAPNFAGIVPLPGVNTVFTFTLPTSMARGTYTIDSIPRNCQCVNEDQTLRTPFDVAAPEVRITDAYLDKAHYEPGETIQLDLVIASDQAVTTRLQTWIQRPDGVMTAGPEQTLDLAASPANLATTLLTLDSDQAGMHQVIYRLADAADTAVTHGQGAERFDVGRALVVAVRTDKTEYEAATEPVIATVMFFATVPLSGDLALHVDGVAVHQQGVTLAAGFQEMTFTLPGGYGRDTHILRATLTENNLDSWRETEFRYATHGPDLIARVPTLTSVQGQTAYIQTIVGNRGSEIAGASTAVLYDGDPAAGVAIATFAVPALSSGASYEVTVPWVIAGRAGSNLLALVVDVHDVVDETNETNNEATGAVEVGPLSHVLTSDQSVYYRSDTAVFTAELKNLDATATLTNLVLETAVYRLNGTMTETLLFTHTQSLLDLAPGQVRQEVVNWVIAPDVADYDMSFLVQQRVAIATNAQPIQTLAASVAPILVTISVEPELHSHYPFYNQTPTISLAASDAAAIYYQWDNEPLLLYGVPFPGSEGERLVRAQPQRDGIQVGPAVERAIIVDTVPPQTAVALDPPLPNGSNDWYTSDITITLSATDVGVGVIETEVSPDGLSWSGYGAPIVFSSEGEFTLYFRSIDLAGNVETAQTIDFKIDKTPPTVVHNGPFTMASNETITLDGTASVDTLSGLQSTAWDTDGDGQYDDGDPVSFSWPGGTGPYTVSLAAVDEAGNVSTADTTVTLTDTPVACDLYPIALHTSSLEGVAVGDVIEDIYNGSQPGNFGWLTWDGNNSVPALVASLTPPGNSYLYINPNDPNDHLISVGDWVQGRPGVAKSRQIVDALDVLVKTEGLNIIVPVWDEVSNNGANTVYRVVDFAIVHLTDYHLPGQNSISARFLGYANGCGNAVTAVPGHTMGLAQDISISLREGMLMPKQAK
ncbi:MAG: VWA domain-containing protein [Anaerolineae bacterium]|nr:VWA domain-containing protein [Anaerolineae bacterium]